MQRIRKTYGAHRGSRRLGQLAGCICREDRIGLSPLSRPQDRTGRLAKAIGELLDRIHLLTAERGELATTLQNLRLSELHSSLALQGGNLSLWELTVADQRWLLDRGWFAFLGVTLDPLVSDAEAWQHVVDPGDMPVLLKLLSEVINGSRDVLESTFRVHRDDGGLAWVMARGNVVERGNDGQALSIAGTMLDVTRWHELEEQLRQSQKMESIGQLAGGIAHEINTPIQFIGDNTRFASRSFTALLELLNQYRAAIACHPDGKLREQLAEAEDQADMEFLAREVPRAVEQTIEGILRVASIVQAMKEYAHPSGSILVSTDLNHLIDNLIIISDNTWRYVARLEFSADRDLPPVPLAPGDLNQAILNIIVNAAQAIEDAGAGCSGLIRISTAREGEMVVLRISDNGCGMTPEVRERIYDPFFTTKDVGRGIGQGLTIARTVIVDRLKGTIVCESEPGRGTTFHIRIPLVPPVGNG